MKKRVDISANYKSVFVNGKTIRFKIDTEKPFQIPSTPELEDVAINDKCLANCPYCYTNALKSGTNFNHIVDKAQLVWGSLQENERPFQIAIGGAGESTIHPDWCEFIKATYDLGITPNYTTNGMHLEEAILSYTEAYCGGVALSYHPHIEKVFHKAVNSLQELDTKLNFHVILSDEDSLVKLKSLYEDYAEVVDYFVILPYQAVGRGKQMEVENTWIKCFDWIKTVEQFKFAFGALFYNFLKSNTIDLQMSIYEPEIFSGYRIMNNNFLTLYKSSYDLSEKTIIRN